MRRLVLLLALTACRGEGTAPLEVHLGHNFGISDPSVGAAGTVTAHLAPLLYMQGGGFRVRGFVQDRELVLERRDKGGGRVEIIRATNVGSEEELWRRFMAGDFDVVPVTSGLLAERLRAVPSARVLELEVQSTVGLYLNLRRVELRDLEVRRGMAALFDRKAIALAAGGRVTEAPGGDVGALRRSGIVGRPFRILVVDSLTTSHPAARVAKEQLAGIGVPAEVESLPGPALLERVRTGAFDGFLFHGHLSADRESLDNFRAGNPGNISGYANPAFDAAFARGDFEAAKQIRDADLPVIPLYRTVDAVAVRRRFCNVHPKVAYDLSWLAELRVCRPGESD